MQHHAKMMIGCVAVIGALAILSSTIGGGTSWAPLLLVLACPLMMISMMYGMSNRSRDETDDADKNADDHTHVG